MNKRDAASLITSVLNIYANSADNISDVAKSVILGALGANLTCQDLERTIEWWRSKQTTHADQ